MQISDSKRAIWSWACYDWANSAYTTTVMAGFFPVFFKQFWASGLSANESTFWLGMANAVSGLLIALLAPILGAVADQGGLKKRMMLSFTTLAVLMTAALFFVTQGSWVVAIAIFTFGSIAFSGANVFYDALIVDVAEYEELDRVSALGYGVGYIGGGLLFALNVLMTLHPDWFGLSDASEAVRVSFLSVAIWWAVFSLPLAYGVHESHVSEQPQWLSATRAGFSQLSETFHQIRQLRQVWLFLLAYFLYIDGVNTVARMAVDYGLSLGFDSSVLITALLVTQFVAFPSALALGWLGEKWHAKGVILICIGVYALVCVWSSMMTAAVDFYTLAIAVGLVIGGIQALSRSMYAKMIPRHQAAEFFGFFNMMGKFAAVLGPVLMGTVSMMTGSSRASILAIVVLFAVGAWLLYRVDVQGETA
ncbi:MAG: MFS transporter [Zetaproteobacteria bacterium CG_4_9_14_3_um_filter_49_83]|nr:MAG: MFS transporter [Zetaproteobacteria bacterium CG1_02_49_23]PIY55178.1 MAG: MFS transporter [Zetaproteobacteria bacterium CG_4_10_14_0_8_um_filter_49_80]PJA35547.1 MAG: MFS transporter [Zetaproteobacteria bacterium CG_4_9_14_3_um_filter_49_83]